MSSRWVGVLLLLTAGCSRSPTPSSSDAASLPALRGAPSAPGYDVVVRGGTVYDGHGGAGRPGDVAIRGDTIAAVAYAGELDSARGVREIDARGLVVAPGFINMISGGDALFADGRGQSDLRQGVTLEVVGEGWSGGPLNEAMKKDAVARQSDIKFPVTWSTLGEYLDTLVRSHVSPNVASFVGATTLREHELGRANRAPTKEELARMQELVRQAMREGALGVSSALIYAPGAYAKTDELIALAQAAAPYHGLYISHLRSEGGALLESIDELLTIAREAHVSAEIYHFKSAGRTNWAKLEPAIARIESARASGLHITANMYPYVAAATGLDASIPPWALEGNYEERAARLRDPATRIRVLQQMRQPERDWENLLFESGSPDNVVLASFKSAALKPLNGKTLAEVAKMRGESPEETVIDLVLEDRSRVRSVYFLMSEDGVRRELSLPWVSFGSDGGAYTTEGVFLNSPTHPRVFGTFARFLGKYVRDEHVVPLEEAIRRLTSLPAENLGLTRRGSLDVGNAADVVVFDPTRIADHATYESPQQYATGVVDVFINGVQVIDNSEHTGAKPGRVVRGPGWTG